MNQQDAREALTQAWTTGWAGATPVVFANEELDPPAAPWVRFSVLHQTGQQETLGGEGNRRFLRSGIVSIQVFVPSGQGGLRNSDALVHTARAIFEGKNFSLNTLRCTNASVREIGEAEGFYQTNIEIDFNYEETK